MQVRDLTEQTEESRAAIEALEPSRDPKALPRDLQFHWTLPDGRPVEKTYTQDELGMFPAQEFTTRVTEIIDSFVKGEFGIKIGELFRGEVDMPVSLDAESTQSFMDDNEQLIQAFIKLVQILPDFQQDVMVLSLGVPRLEREWAKQQLSEPPHRGGLTVEEGFDILIKFIQQNALLVRETVRGKTQELVDAFRLEVLQQEPSTEDQTSSVSTARDSALTAAPPTTEKEPTSPGGTPSSTSSPPTPASA